LADQLLADVTADGTADGVDAETALRGTVRWARSYERARAVSADGASEDAGLRRGGAYLFSGALTGAGYSMMEHLVGQMEARIALVVDPAIPERAEWDAHLASHAHRHDATTHTISWLRAAEANGVAPLLLRAGTDDAAALRSAIGQARAEFGRLDGIVHAPGLGAAASYAPLATSPVEPVVTALARLDGELAALRDATAGAALDFVLLQGSTVPATTGTGVGGAAAAYAMIDGWAQRVAADGDGPWTSAGWDRWRVDGEEGGDGIHPAEGVRAFGRLAALAGEPRVLVTPGDPAMRGARPSASTAAKKDDALHARPELRTDFQAPASPAEERIAAVWRDLFGIAEIGVRDDFFLLGGHSLLAMQLVSRVRDLFQVDIPLPAVFEAPTIAGLAEVVNEAVLLELEGMSEEDVMSELHIHGSGGRGGEAAVGEASPHLLLAALDELSDEALDRLLAGDSDEGTFQ
ncbi:MAG TPA: phosphopantetheine-binding protein, partial [Longimicrobium sp.]|nr:phosphopantetheine-binding protein [Longimicrobium sp.]